jgi:NAD+ kinase
MKNCLIVINTHKKESHITGQLIANYLSKKGIKSSFFCFDGFSSENPFYGYDFVVTLGGDGTVLFAARGCVDLEIPIFPVNFGEFGFIASVQQNEWESLLNDFLEGAIPIEQRSMLRADVFSVENNTSCFSSLGLNDVVICAKTAARTICLNITSFIINMFYFNFGF